MPENQKDKELDTKKNISIEMELFGRSTPSYYVLKKGERLTSALYLVTDLLPIDDPLRGKIRSAGLHALSLIVNLSDATRGADIKLQAIKEAVGETVTLLRVAVVAGHISTMNLSILEREYYGLIDFCEQRGGMLLHEEQKFKAEFFNLPDTLQTQGGQKELEEHKREWSFPEYIGHIKGQLPPQNDVTDRFRNLSVHERTDLNRRPSVSNGLVESAKRKSSRRNTIINLVKKKGRVSVKDVAQHITGCSEKTLQRELLGLVSEGVLKKEGERRWSTYTII